MRRPVKVASTTGRVAVDGGRVRRSSPAQVIDEAGKPVVGAKVTIKLKNITGTAVSDDKGNVHGRPSCRSARRSTARPTLDDTGAEVTVEVDGKKPGAATLTLAKGTNTVPPIKLEPMLPPGQLRGVVRQPRQRQAGRGRDDRRSSPAARPQTSSADGTFTVDLAPGSTRSRDGRGLAQQELDVTIDPNGVAIKNIDLHK